MSSPRTNRAVRCDGADADAAVDSAADHVRGTWHSAGPGGSLAAISGAATSGPVAQAALAAAGTPQMLDDESMVKIVQIEGQMRASSLRCIGELVDKHPDETLAIVRGWMVQENS